MRRYKLDALVVLGTWLLATGSAHAHVVATGGQVVYGPAPASVDYEALESETDIVGFQELDDIVVGAMPLDATGSGEHTADSPASARLADDARIDVYLFHADTARDDPYTALRYRGWVRFDEPVLGLVLATGTLDDWDRVVATHGSTGTFYPIMPGGGGPGGFRGLEWMLPCGFTIFDCVRISSDLRTVEFDFGITIYMDQVRVITAAEPVPAPVPAALLLAGLAALAATPGRLTCARRRG